MTINNENCFVYGHSIAIASAFGSQFSHKTTSDRESYFGVIILIKLNRSFVSCNNINHPEKRTASSGMVDSDLENGRSECVDDCNAIL